MDTLIERFCPICKFKNEGNATICANCQTPLENIIATQITTKHLAGNGELLSQAERDALLKSNLPEKGLSIYIVNSGELILVGEGLTEFVLGRRAEDTEGYFVNIGAYDAFVSRRHAKIRKTESGYEIMDLESSNGTWLEGQRLVPNKPYALQNSAQIRFGHIQVMIQYA